MENKISVHNLKKNFGKLEVLKDISIEIREGEVVCMIGPSGSGKSTFLRCLNRLEKITSGHVVVDGHPMSDPNTNINKVRENIGMVFQHFNLFPHLTVRENITLAPTELKIMGKEEAGKKALELLARVGLADKAEAYPGQLSGGQKQRVAIAGVIAMEPECIVLDEATAMLDPHGRREVLDTIHRLNRERGMTVVLITHHMAEAEEADRVIVMNDGEAAMDGTPREIFAQVERLHELGLAAPDTVELMQRLNRQGEHLPLTAITVEECADALYRRFGAEGK